MEVSVTTVVKAGMSDSSFKLTVTKHKPRVSIAPSFSGVVGSKGILKEYPSSAGQ